MTALRFQTGTGGDIRYPQPPIGIRAETGERPACDKESQVHHSGRVRMVRNSSVHSLEFHCLFISRTSLSFEERGVWGAMKLNELNEPGRHNSQQQTKHAKLLCEVRTPRIKEGL